MDVENHEPTGILQQQWNRRQVIWGGVGLTAATLISIFAKPQIVSLARDLVGSPVSSGKINLYQFDYYYIPNYMTWRVGDKLEITLQNQSHTHWHEWTIGRKLNMDYFQGFGYLDSDAWAIDFWDGVDVTLSDPYKIDNFVPNKAHVTYVGPKGPYQITTGGDFSPTLQPGGSLKLTFTVPNKPGLWHFGCFVQEFIHYRDGMQGLINILPA
ncbi:hypothetical protein [Sulfobacillus thermosulfidooxidans]|uniref:hypothetical protein n=1 Tax=Sulfobacillus thermosulfidooxidans TaxID=28034 RepID=UPI0002FD391E|nr:hypothetical protein [Sulfobacillus thermosulfidooxidans]